MRIDRLKTSPDRSGRYLVFFSDGSSMRLYRQTLEDLALFAGKELSEEEMEQLRLSASKYSAKMRAVRIVSQTSISKKELESRLIRKGEDPEQAKGAVGWLSDLNLLDDRNTAEQIVHSCISKGYGKARAKQALYEKRIPRELWEEALSDYPDQMERITAFLQSRLDGASDERATKKAIDALMRKGHSYHTIKEALNELSFSSEGFSEEETEWQI